MPATMSPTASSAAPDLTARAAPMRPHSQPDDGSESTAPMLRASSSRPSWDGVRVSSSRTSGIRLARLVNAIPAVMKTTITPAWARCTRALESIPSASAVGPCTCTLTAAVLPERRPAG